MNPKYMKAIMRGVVNNKEMGNMQNELSQDDKFIEFASNLKSPSSEIDIFVESQKTFG